MAHFAKLDENNIVEHVIVIDNNNLLDTNGQESEEIGIVFINSIPELQGRWIQTSYNSSFRGKYAGVGFTYNEEEDIFEDLRVFPQELKGKEIVKPTE